LAFLVTFCVLLGAGALWMGLFVWFDEAPSAALNALAAWLSPERVSGWIFYIALSALCFVPFLKRLRRIAHDPEHGRATPPKD